MVLIRCANAGFVVEKTLARGLADFFHNTSPLGNQAQPGVFSERFLTKHRRAICVAEWAMGFENPVQARLRRDLKAQRQIGLPKHSPTLFCPSV